VAHWIRFEQNGRIGFGTLKDGEVAIHEGDLYDSPRSTGSTIALSAVRLLTPCVPSKLIGLWNNFHALAAKLGIPVPAEPLYFLKASNSFLASGETIEAPKLYDGRVVYEGELGVVIGKRCKAVSAADADAHIFGYTCVNDVTATELIPKDPAFQQWTRAKSYDTFGVFGPAIATGLDPLTLTVRTLVNGRERQNYPVSDMVFKPRQLVSLISQDITLYPGDIISCGTSLGALPMKSGTTVEVIIDGIGTLANEYR
jgi:2-keto-4-pentenoate hydratase/2-oxohepta-3-ene-1,7-dioic acid hydratase in catechol pathway